VRGDAVRTGIRAPKLPAALAKPPARVLDQAFFRRLLVTERKRSERSSQAFALLLVEGRPGSLAAVLEALAAAKRETDVLGWFERPGTVGLILPELEAPAAPVACAAILERVRQELACRLPPETAARLAITAHVYPESARGDQRGTWVVDPVLYPDLAADGLRRRASDAIKRGIDVGASLALLLVLAPLLGLIAALVKLTSRGPVLFRQVRVGQMATPFTMLKFRSMRVNTDERLHQDFVSRYIKESGKESGRSQASGDQPVFKLTNDPRVTPLGRLLRKTSLDELPQLWNVLRGEMSLVGPRPPLPYELEQYAPWHRRRVLEAKPGITGLWQVGGRSRTTFDEMVRLDLQYARVRSLWTDIKILLATPAAVVSGKGAG
jgi:lipopolysaccharide/colanic/teichoic acid biosynthesis glycosyltransferase